MCCKLAPIHTYFTFQNGDLLETYYPLPIRISHKYFYVYFNL
jgi:hypothetical protein